MGSELDLTELRGRVSGPVFTPEDEGFAEEVACFNLAIRHSPDLVVGAGSTDDIREAVLFAAANGLKVSVQAAGHTLSTITSGLLVTTKRMDEVEIDPAAGTVTVGAGVQWQAVIEAAAGHGLAPVAGSSPLVSVVGYLTGGGLGPLVRSHGVSSDYLLEATVVSGDGEVLRASADENQELLWALRGGKYGLGIVAGATVRLAELENIYAGSLFYAEDDIEAALRGWIDWTAGADERVSTSAAIIQFPPFDFVPEPLRGRRLLNLRFVFPGDAEDGEALAAPLRSLAPVHLDALGEIPAAAIATVHNDPTDPSPSWVRGGMLDSADQELASVLLSHVGAGTVNPFVVCEMRHLGAAAARDVDGGSAVGGREASFILSVVGLDPGQFETGMPAAFGSLVGDAGRWISEETNINFLGKPDSEEHLASAWPAGIRTHLAEVRARYDPEGIFAAPSL